MDIIDNFAQGDAISIQRRLLDLPVGQVLTKAWMTVKFDPSASDDDAVFQISATTVLSSGGQVTGANTFTLIMGSAQSELIVPGRRYYYDIQVMTDTELLYTIESGRIRSKPPITLATA